MKVYFIVISFLFFSYSAFSKEVLKKYRGTFEPTIKKESPVAAPGGMTASLLSNEFAVEPATESQVGTQAEYLPGVGEKIFKRKQTIGLAVVDGTWKQTVYSLSHKVVYAAGEIYENLPAKSLVESQMGDLQKALASAKSTFPELKKASKVFPEKLEVRQNADGSWIPYWRIEYLSEHADRLSYILVTKSSNNGSVMEKGQLPWDGADGRAYVFPKGPKYSGVEEEVLHDLSGDGTITGRLLNVFSTLDLKVWSPDLTFFFPQDDRRFDLGQAYYTIDQGYRWFKENVGVELPAKVNVQLHVGKDGISNAAFYHQNQIYLGTGDGVLYKDMLKDPSILIHESMHAIIDVYAGLPSEGEGGGFNEGFADLFTALILSNPKMGEGSYLKAPYRRTLENKLIAFKDFAPGVYQNGSIVGATFWDMKSELGNALTAKLAFKTLVRLGRGAVFTDFLPSLQSACADLLTDTQKEFALAKARSRGWK